MVQVFEDLSSLDALKIGQQTLAVLFSGLRAQVQPLLAGCFWAIAAGGNAFSFFLAMPILFLACIKVCGTCVIYPAR